MVNGQWSMVKRGIAAAAILLAGACQRHGATLEQIEGHMTERLAKVSLGDFSGFTFEPPVQTDWFVIYPAGATAGAFAASPAFQTYVGQVPAELLNQAEPGMAFVRDRKVIESRVLIPAFNARRVFAKPGSVSHGVRFVRLVGVRRNYDILGID